MMFLRSVAAEFAKVRSTRMWWILAIVLFAYAGLMAGGLGAFFGWVSEEPAVAEASGQSALPPGTNLPALIYSFATSVGYVFPVLLGALAVTGEFRHQTLTPTFLASPKRVSVLAAKFVALFAFGALYGLFGFIASVGFGAIALNGFGIDTMLGEPDTWALVGRGVLAMALWAIIGVGLGALVPNQVASIVIVIAFTQFIEPLLRFVAVFNDVTANIAQYLPGSASDALVGASFYTFAGVGASTITWWVGGLVLLAIAVVAGVVGYFTSWRRDVT